MENSLRVYAKIDGDALIYNIKNIRKMLDKSIKIMPVIKADAYGHGALFVYKKFEEEADYFAVAILEEALELRKGGLEKPILLLGHTAPSLFENALSNNVTMTLFSLEEARLLSKTAKEKNCTAKIHIALDTGMGRIGFPAKKESVALIKEISELENIFIEGIFTHFATSDEKDRSFTNLQIKKFNDFVDALEKENINIPIKHISNSAAIMDYENARWDMVRPGIINYGLYPSDDVKKEKLPLKPAMELITQVAFVKTIEEGDTVSYGRTFQAKEKMKIATIPVGYADGYPRLLSNKGRVIINGKYAPIIGRICMDQFMVDVSEIPQVNVGDQVVLMGRQGECFVSADEIASLTDTINYEIICGIGKRVPRVYIG